MTCAAEHGLCVTKPWGETARYDFAVEHEGHFVRVQVKSTMFMDRGGYSCTVRGCRGPYEGDPFDFVAAYLIPLDLWYIIPAEKCQGQGSIALYPRLKKSKYGMYKGAWHLLRGSTGFRGLRLVRMSLLFRRFGRRKQHLAFSAWQLANRGGSRRLFLCDRF